MTAENLKELWTFRELLSVWALREIRIRYKQSVLGVAWALLQPIALMLVLTAVFSFFAKIPSDGLPYPAFSLVGLLPWTFLATSLTFGSTSLITNINLVTKIYFPREVLPLGHIIAALLDFLVASAALFGLLLFYGLPFWKAPWWLLILIPLQLLLAAAVTIPASALMVQFRDLRFVVPLLLQVWMFASPIAYPTSLVPEKFQLLYRLNPVTGLVNAYRQVLLQGTGPDPAPLLWTAIFSVLVLAVGYGYFKRAERTFADRI